MPAKGQEYPYSASTSRDSLAMRATPERANGRRFAMQPAVFIARLIGPAFVAIGLGILLNGPFYTALILEAVHSPTLIYFSGLISLIPGLAILNVHRTWTGGWPVIVTIIGWLLVIGGVIRLMLPATTATLATDIYSHPIVLLIVAIVVLVVGAFLCFEGYRARNK